MWVRVATFEGGDTEKLDALMQKRMSSGEMTPPEGLSSVLILDTRTRTGESSSPSSTAARRSTPPRPASTARAT